MSRTATSPQGGVPGRHRARLRRPVVGVPTGGAPVPVMVVLDASGLMNGNDAPGAASPRQEAVDALVGTPCPATPGETVGTRVRGSSSPVGAQSLKPGQCAVGAGVQLAAVDGHRADSGPQSPISVDTEPPPMRSLAISTCSSSATQLYGVSTCAMGQPNGLLAGEADEVTGVALTQHLGRTEPALFEIPGSPDRPVLPPAMGSHSANRPAITSSRIGRGYRR